SWITPFPDRIPCPPSAPRSWKSFRRQTRSESKPPAKVLPHRLPPRSSTPSSTRSPPSPCATSPCPPRLRTSGGQSREPGNEPGTRDRGDRPPFCRVLRARTAFAGRRACLSQRPGARDPAVSGRWGRRRRGTHPRPEAGRGLRQALRDREPRRCERKHRDGSRCEIGKRRRHVVVYGRGLRHQPEPLPERPLRPG